MSLGPDHLRIRVLRSPDGTFRFAGFRPGGSPTAGPAAHNHILNSRGGGWFHTVNIRVFSLAAWNEIAAAKTLAKVRELQGDPSVGTPGVISADTPTNIFFFIASWRPVQE